MNQSVVFWKAEGRDRIMMSDAENEAIEVKFAWLRPLSFPQGLVAVLEQSSGRFLTNVRLSDLNDASRALAQEYLEANARAEVIQQVIKVRRRSNMCLWDVKTSCSSKTLRVPYDTKGIFRLDDTCYMLRDLEGLVYVIRNAEQMDSESKQWLSEFL